MNFHQLQYFKIVFETGNITKAAEKLHISQPAVSTAIRELEAELGIRLFIRQNRGLTATEEGTVFYGLACKLLLQCEHAKHAVKEVSGRKRLVRLGMAPMIGHILFPKIYQRLSEQYPDMELEILEEGTFELQKRLEEDQVELIIVPEGVESPEYERREIYRTQMVFAISSRHPLARLEKLEVKQLAGVPLALYRRGYIQNRHIEQMFDHAQVQPKVMTQASNFMTIKTLIDCGAAGGFLMREICEDQDWIKVFEFSELPPSPVHLIWKKEGYLSNGASAFIKCCGGLAEEAAV